MGDFFAKIPVAERVVRYWRIFSRYVGGRLWIYIAISFLATLTDGLGLSLFFPLLNGLQGGGGAHSVAEQRFASVLEAIGLNYNVQGILLSIAVIFVIKASLQFGAGAYQSRIITDYLSVLAKGIYGAITGQEYRHFLERNIGVLSNVVVNEASRAMVSLVKFASLFPSLIAIAVFSVLAFRLDPWVTLAAAIFGVGILSLTRIIARMARRFSVRNSEAYGKLNGLILQSFGSYKYLRSTMSLEPLRRQTELTVDQLCASQFGLSTTANFSASINEPIVVIFVIGMVWQRTVIAGHPISQVVVLALFFYRLMKEVMNFQSSWHAFSGTLGSVDLISKVTQESEARREVFSGRDYPGILGEIRFEGVSFSYGAKEVLHEIDLKIPHNAMVAVVGESGSGKSTFVDLLTGLLRPSGGNIFLDTLPYSALNIATFRRRVGFVTQEPALFNDTIENNISLWDGGDAAEVRARVSAAAKAANCLSFVEGMPKGLDTILGDRGVNLSGGQRQRVAIARELYKRPDLLILDEATSALDSETELEIQKSIEGLKGRLTTVVVAHRLSTIRNADLIYVFSNGRIVEKGAFDSLFASQGSHFRKYCDLQGLS